MASDRSGSIIRLVLILAAAITLFALIAYYRQSRTAHERFTASAASASASASGPATTSQYGGDRDRDHDRAWYETRGGGGGGIPSPIEPMSNEAYLPLPKGSAGTGGPASPTDPFPYDRITPDQLLPKDASNSQWAMANPAGQGDVKDQNFLTAGYHIGFDTQGSSLRNASHDFRSTPPNPRYNVGIWNQSTIEPDLNRRPLE